MGQCSSSKKKAASTNERKSNDERPSETGGDKTVVENTIGETQKLLRTELEKSGDCNVVESEKKVTIKKERKSFWKRLFHRKAKKTEENHRPETEEENAEAQTQTNPAQDNINKHTLKCPGYVERDYIVGKKLGEGGFGTVYEGQRISNGLPVALKFVKRKKVRDLMRIPGCKELYPPEVALMVQMQRGPRNPLIIHLHAWYETPTQFILVLERPLDFEDMYTVALQDHSYVTEYEACILMRQVVQAACACKKLRVFHRDITPRNVLVHRETLEVKLIDFGASQKFTKTKYKTYVGAEQYAPPELFIKGKYGAESTTVWSLGMMMFRMVCGRYPDTVELHRIYANIWRDKHVSIQLRDLITSCLKFDEKKRPSLEKILEHIWFQE